MKTWIGELDIIMQSANIPYKRAQNKHGKHLNFVYHFRLEHTGGLARPASLDLPEKHWTSGTNQNLEWLRQFGTDIFTV